LLTVAVPQFTAEAIVQKLRFIALVALAAQSSNQQLSFADIASGLAIDLSEVELYVIDGAYEQIPVLSNAPLTLSHP
jgi:hypothetical protein